MSKQQLRADVAGAKRNLGTVPDERRISARLHRTNQSERDYRERGIASDSPAWRDHNCRYRD
jgi:hypothetical protein